MIYEKKYRGCPAVVLENDSLKVIVLTEGAKFVSVYRKDKAFELLFQGNEAPDVQKGLAPLDRQFVATGFDDCFPTIHACKTSVEGEMIHYPDHGETWRLGFEYRIQGESLILSCNSTILPYHFEKIVSLSGDTVAINYHITNTGSFDFPCIWAMHCLINCEEDMQLSFPLGTKQVLNVNENRYLGKVGVTHPFPATHTPEGKEFRLDRVLSSDSDNCNKYYVKGRVAEGKCGAYYPSKDVRYTVRFDSERLPYLGFWVTEGALDGDYNCALEPTNGYYDDINTARRENGLYILKTDGTLQFGIEMELK
jgi:galactose mutarotase-like enzyme